VTTGAPPVAHPPFVERHRQRARGIGVQHGAHRTAFARPSLDRLHQPRADTLAPVRLHDTERINIDPDFSQEVDAYRELSSNLAHDDA
jgi:hypothetical protein